MKKKLLASLILMAGSSAVFAQANNFEGFTAGVNVSSVGGTTTQSAPGLSTDYGQQSFVPGLELGYNYAATQNIVLGLTATYDLADSKLGQQSAFGQSGDFKGQNRYSVNFKPGFLVTPSTMIYATVGYNSMTQKIQGAGQSYSNTFNGIGYGAGVSVMVDKNVFVKAEVQQVNFNSVSYTSSGITGTSQPNLTIGTIGVGYKF